MKHLTILSYSLARQCVDSFLTIASNLQEREYQVEHIGLTDFSSVSNVRKIVFDTYCKFLKHVYVLPRIDHVDFLGRVNDIVKLHQPDIFLTDNERTISVFLTNYLYKRGIPSVMIDHGYLSKPPFIYQNPISRFIKHQFDRFNNYRACKEIDMKQKVNLLMKNPSGMRSNNFICTSGELNKMNYLRYGVDARRIIVTGFPYFDKVVNQKKTLIRKKFEKKRLRRKKILIISSGLGMLSGQKEDAEQFARFIIAVARLISHDFDITLRFKPGENIFSMLSPQTSADLRSSKLRFDDSRQKSYHVVAVHDLVMGDASFVLLESIIIGKPVIIFHYSKVLSCDRDADYFFRNRTSCLILEDPRQIREYIKEAFSSAYRQLLTSNLKKNERDLFCKLDGHAGKRVAEVILKAVSQTKTNR